MKKLIIIRGPLGVGKITVSKVLSEKIKANYLSLDQMLEENNLDSPDWIPVENFLRANEIILKMTNKDDTSFIVDGCFYCQEQIDDLKSKFKDDLIIFTLVSDVETCIERDSKRAKVYGEDSTRFVHMITSKVKAGHEIDNSDLTIDETVDEVMKKI